MYEQKVKIEEMFLSDDHEMVRLGQKLCHALRIKYYIIIRYAIMFDSEGLRQRRRVHGYTVVKDKWVELPKVLLGYSIYEIKFEENGKAVRIKHECS